MNTTINQLITFALHNNMINEEDINYSVNLLLDLFKLDYFEQENVEEISIYEILDKMLEYAVSNHLIEDTNTNRDLFDTRIMNCVMPRPSEVINNFNELKKENPIKATNYFYNLSINSNYIRKSRTDKNIKFTHFYKYGDIQISINLSKPEKDPKEIEKAKNEKSTGYPKCLLCKENVGFAGNLNHAARQTHRIIPLDLNHSKYFMQYSPYVYYNEHCIIFNDQHVPMKISRATFENLFSFVNQFPHYMIGSNADLPIVGGSILSHDHYQGGSHHFPIEDAEIIEEYQFNDSSIKAQILNWPLSTLRLISKNRHELIDFSEKVLNKWIEYSDIELDIYSHSNGERHNTITPIVRKKDEYYQIDLVLRNNRKNDEYPDGIFHPHKEYHHIKKENIGLIEVMGLAILPARLKTEIEDLKECLLGKQEFDKCPSLKKHELWFNELKKMNLEPCNIDQALEKEVTRIFVNVLENAGVFKMNEKGIKGFKQFVESL